MSKSILKKKVITLTKNNDISNVVEKRLIEFSKNKCWFSELCFCILTANSKAITAIQIQKKVKEEGFLKLDQNQLSKIIRENKHRFHNNKSNYIVQAREYKNIKLIIKNLLKENNIFFVRDWIANNIKGLGLKESSHFLRNIGYFDLAILDRHIINLFVEHKLIKKPKSLTKKIYLDIEKKFINFSKELNMNCAKTDLYLWYLKTGEILK